MALNQLVIFFSNTVDPRTVQGVNPHIQSALHVHDSSTSVD